MEGRDKFDVGTQFSGNHAGVQADLAPASMYGTSSSLDARFTMEMDTFSGGDYDGRLRAEAGLLIAPPPPPPQQQATRRGKKEKDMVALGAGAEAYLQLLLQARSEARDARDQITAMTGGRPVHPTLGRETIQPQFAGRTGLSEMYESVGGGMEDLKGKLRRESPIKKEEPAVKTPEKR